MAKSMERYSITRCDRSSVLFPVTETPLPQGIYVGYRSYEVRNLETLFPFGHGLSYTTYEYDGIEATSVTPEGKFSVSFNVKNTGKTAGREVAQIYISDLQSYLPRPVKELKGFTKVSLKPGESKRLAVDLDKEALGFYDHLKQAWVAEAGKFHVLVAESSASVRLTAEVELAKTISWTGL